MLRSFLLFLLLCFTSYSSSGNNDSLRTLKTRKIILGSGTAAFTVGSLIFLHQAWFADYKTSKFHFFNDNEEWFQMDKMGHTYSNYQAARLMMQAMDWAGFKNKQQLLIGGLSGFTYMTAVEIMDGYSSGWGFSWGDMAANAVGTGLAIGQKIFWKEQRIQLKFSFHKTDFPQYRSSLLGETFPQQILKDYNGQTYWLSINPASFLKQDTKFPKWLNIAFGHGASGMIGAKYNNILVIDEQGNTKFFPRYRQFYFSLDADLTKIKTKSKLLKTVFSVVNVIKIPFPNLELSQGTLKFNPY